MLCKERVNILCSECHLRLLLHVFVFCVCLVLWSKPCESIPYSQLCKSGQQAGWGPCRPHLSHRSFAVAPVTNLGSFWTVWEQTLGGLPSA